MAIYNSLLLGKSRGSVGNLTTTKIKNRPILKSKIPSRKFIPSQLQLDQRTRLINSANAYSTIAVPFLYAKNMCKKGETLPNAFSRIYTPLSGSTLFDSRNSWIRFLVNNTEFFFGNYISVVDIDQSTDQAFCTIDKNGYLWHEGIFLVYCLFDNDSDDMQWRRISIPENQWTSQYISIECLNIVHWCAFVWVYDSISKKISNYLIK